jgi:hypothetical protein
MAATAWTFYNSAKKKLGQNTGGIRLDAGIFKLSLHQSTSNASNVAHSILSSVNNEIAAQGGYVAGGRTLAGVQWTIAGGSVKWDTNDLVFTASGANLSNVKFAVVHYSVGAATSGPVLCWSRLSTAQFSVTTGNTLTIQMANAGVFTLT